MTDAVQVRTERAEHELDDRSRNFVRQSSELAFCGCRYLEVPVRVAHSARYFARSRSADITFPDRISLRARANSATAAGFDINSSVSSSDARSSG